MESDTAFNLTFALDLHSKRLHILWPWDEEIVMDIDVVACCAVQLKVKAIEYGPHCDEDFCERQTA